MLSISSMKRRLGFLTAFNYNRYNLQDRCKKFLRNLLKEKMRKFYVAGIASKFLIANYLNMSMMGGWNNAEYLDELRTQKFLLFLVERTCDLLHARRLAVTPRTQFAVSSAMNQ